MGIESFFVKIPNINEELFYKIYKNKTINKVINMEYNDNELCLEGSVFTFLSSASIIYKAFEIIYAEMASFKYTTLNCERFFYGCDEFTFIQDMFLVWNKKLSNVSKEYGYLIINPKESFKIKRKIKKYFLKL